MTKWMPWWATFFLITSSLFAQAETDSRLILVVVGLSQEAKIASGPEAQVVVSAGNFNQLQQKLKAIDPKTIRAVVSFGVAGALDPSLKIGDIVLASRMTGHQQNIPVDLLWRHESESRLARGHLQSQSVPFIGLDELSVFEPLGRSQLRENTLTDVIDLESHWAGEFAAQNGLPFLAVRAISDSAGQTLPPAARLKLRPDGSADLKAIAKDLVRDPSQWSGLVQMGITSKRAFDSLRKIRSALGPSFGLITR